MDMQITTRGLKGRPLDRDRLNMVPRKAAAEVAMLLLQPIEQQPPEAALLGTATLFAALCRRCGVDPSGLHEKGLRVLDAPEEGDRNTDSIVQVLRDFAGARFMGQEVSLS